jgi:hypothetical protein
MTAELIQDDSPTVADLVDAHLAVAGITVTAEERDMFVDDFPMLREYTEKLYAFGDGLEPVLVFDPGSFYAGRLR